MTNTATQTAAIIKEAFSSGFRQEQIFSIAEWADTHRILSSVASSEPGRWRTARTPYLREIMDCLSPLHPATRVVVMAGAQVGKTESGNCWIGYVIDQSPGPMLIVQPTVETAKRVSKQRITPMIEATPTIRSKIRESKIGNSGNTVQVKEFDGGVLIITGANSGAGLRSMPVRYLFMDEIDEYPVDVDGQGDPVALAEKRTDTFQRRKVYLTSTPTVKGLSRIEREFSDSDQRRYYVPCPHCGNFDTIRWENIRWDEHLPETARLFCCACSVLIEEHHKTEMLAAGEWRPTNSGTHRTVGFHLSALYSPIGWKAWSDCVADFLIAKTDQYRLKTWVNMVLGETWEERGESIKASSLRARVEHYDGEVPDGVGVLVAACDVQNDRIEAIIVGFGAAEESWLVAYSQFHGDPAIDTVWFDLDKFLQQTFVHKNGWPLKVECTVVDSGGANTEQVYKFCKARPRRRVFAIKGGNTTGRPLVERPSIHNRYRIPLFILCVDTGKDVVLSRLKIATPGPGYMHLPVWIDDEYLEQLASEKALRKYKKGRGAVREWVKLRERNEALDMTVYALAALYILGVPFIRLLPNRVAKLSAGQPLEPLVTDDSSTDGGAPSQPGLSLVRPRKSWVTNY